MKFLFWSYIQPWVAIIFFNHFKKDLDGVKSIVGLCFIRIHSNYLPNPIYPTKVTKPNILNQIFTLGTKTKQIYQTKSTKLNLILQAKCVRFEEPNILNQVQQTKSIHSNLQNQIPSTNSTKQNIVPAPVPACLIFHLFFFIYR